MIHPNPAKPQNAVLSHMSNRTSMYRGYSIQYNPYAKQWIVSGGVATDSIQEARVAIDEMLEGERS